MIDKLKSVLRQPDTVLFVGSGVSLWSGLPTWRGLIEELSEFLNEEGLDSSLVDQELQRGDLLQAASFGFDKNKITKYQIMQFLKRACRLGIAKPHEIHQKLMELGPQCYVTTNYDKLIELSFNKWRPDEYYRIVVNRQLTETAEIVGTRATNFLFKLHGDVEDSDSIILTREQYRILNPGGELNHALETVKTLMVSRPFVYVGFGLKDPDFLYVKDLLFNTYKGGSRDHYAIIADIKDQEKDYWKREYGIHLISYQTIEKPGGKKDHSQLLTLLDQLCEIPTVEKYDLTNAEFLLGLTRHASKYLKHEKLESYIPLVASLVTEKRGNRNDIYYYRYSNEAIENILDNGPDKFVLIGLPGSGKSYSLKSSISRLSEELVKVCIDGTFNPETITIPIFGDLKLYRGHIRDLLENELPLGMSLNFMLSNFKIKVYLDAFNEMPRNYIEDNSWDVDFADFLKSTSQLQIIITSRTDDGLDNLELPIFNIDLIEREFIETNLSKFKIELKGIFKEDVISILQRPFFYKLVFTSKFQIDSETSPKKIYTDLIFLLNSDFQKRFEANIDLLPVLGSVAFNSIDNGEEAFKSEQVKKYLREELSNAKNILFTADDIINWLVSREFLFPLINERICFFHQSVTEFLAATKLARIFETTPNTLREKLSFRRWDQALFLTLSLLSEEKSSEFLNILIEIDFDLALSAVRYVDYNSVEIIEKLLIQVKNRASSNESLKYSLGESLERQNLPVTSFHIPSLRKLIKYGDALGGAAVSIILEILKEKYKEDALNLLVKHCDDYNFCSAIGRALEQYITEDDLPKLLDITNRVQNQLGIKSKRELEGFDSSLSTMLQGMNPYLVYETFYIHSKSTKEQKIHLDVLEQFLQDTQTYEALVIAAELLLIGFPQFAVAIYFILKYSEEREKFDYSFLTNNHVVALTEIVISNDERNRDWAFGSLKIICDRRKDLLPFLKNQFQNKNGVLKAAFIYAITEKEDYSLVFEELESILHFNPNQLSEEPFSLIRDMDLEWQGHEALFVRLLKLRNLQLTYNLCESVYDIIVFETKNASKIVLDIGIITWWLDWFLELDEKDGNEWMFEDRVSRVIVNYVSRTTRQQFIDEFNNSNSIYRKVLGRKILPKLYDLSIEELTDDSILYLLEEIKTVFFDKFEASILVNIATEPFVIDRLLPLLKIAKNQFYENLLGILDKVGRKHGRRYIEE